LRECRVLVGCLLPFRFDPVRLEHDLGCIRTEEWVPHFNTQEYEGEWHGVALRSVNGASSAIYPDPNSDAAFVDTPALARCPYFQAILAELHFPVRSVRLLRLGPDSRIREHRDYKLGYEDGEIRIHIPITTNQDVDFVVNGQKLQMCAGESWYINFNLPHRVVNRGRTPRIHLVIDCAVNDWLRERLPPEVTIPPAPPPAPLTEPAPRSPSELARFRTIVHEDPALAEELRDIVDRQLFTERVVSLAAARGCRFAPEDVDEGLRAGRRAWLERHVRAVSAAEPLPTVQRVPDLARWMPIRVFAQDGRLIVDWCYIGGRRLREPFFEQSVGECLRLPFNVLFRRQTSVEMLTNWHETRPGLTPSGLIFHMSRCGSTLISQMLAAVPGNIVLSEAGPIDDVLRVSERLPGVTDEQRIGWLRGVVSALGQPKRTEESRLFVKLDAWHALDLPLTQAAFPGVPAIFLYRNPLEVLVSQRRQPASYLVPGMLGSILPGMDFAAMLQLPVEEYTARVLARICQAAVDWQEHTGTLLLVNYQELPEAVWSTIASFCGMECSSDEIERMRRATQFNAKNPAMFFTNDTADKEAQATAGLRETAAAWLGPVYARLEALRARHCR
jgi:hypothetical protein